MEVVQLSLARTDWISWALFLLNKSKSKHISFFPEWLHTLFLLPCEVQLYHLLPPDIFTVLRENFQGVLFIKFCQDFKLACLTLCNTCYKKVF